MHQLHGSRPHLRAACRSALGSRRTCRQCAARSASAVDVLTQDQLQQFHNHGYLAIEGFATPQECEALKARANEIVEAFDPESVSIFSTTRQEELTDAYFLDSASNVSCFFEEGAFDAAGALRQPKALSINKIGHALHDRDPAFRAFSRSAKMAALYRQLGFRRPLPVQSMYIFKQPKVGGEVVPHQDSAFLATEPLSCVGMWLAVEDATVGNGCLFVMDDSHRDGVTHRMVRDAAGTISWPNGKPQFDIPRMKPLETAAGTLVLLHGSNVHGSNANTSPQSRHAYSMHVVEGAAGFEWLPDNWLQRPPELPFEPLYE